MPPSREDPSSPEPSELKPVRKADDTHVRVTLAEFIGGATTVKRSRVRAREPSSSPARVGKKFSPLVAGHVDAAVT